MYGNGIGHPILYFGIAENPSEPRTSKKKWQRWNFLKWFIQINSIISNVITIQHERSESTCLVLYVEVRQDGATVANKTKIRFKK
jgi:hypothetical protein